MKKGLSTKLAEINARLDGLKLSDEEREAVRVRAQEHVEKEEKDKAIDFLFAQEVKLARQQYRPDERIEDVMLDLPKHAAMIRLDNVVYFHGLIYSVPYGVARVLADTMSRMWEHQSEIEGRPRRGDQAMQPRMNSISPMHEHMNMRSAFTSGVRQ